MSRLRALDNANVDPQVAIRGYGELFAAIRDAHLGILGSIGDSLLTGGLPGDPFAQPWRQLHEFGVFLRWKS